MSADTSEPKRRFAHPAQPAGLLVAAWFLFRFLAWFHLALFGTVVEGRTGVLPPGMQAPFGEPVPYFYQGSVQQPVPYSGWREGIEYGGQRLAVVYSPLANSFHATCLRAIESSSGLWREDTYVLRLLLYVAGVFCRASGPRTGRGRPCWGLTGTTR
jgi:hypothetical protein